MFKKLEIHNVKREKFATKLIIINRRVVWNYVDMSFAINEAIYIYIYYNGEIHSNGFRIDWIDFETIKNNKC